MPTSASLRPLLARALERLVRHVGGADAGDDLPGLVRAYFRAKAERGGAAVGTALGLPDADLAPFEAALRDVERTARRLAEPAPGATDERNAVLAGVRLVSWLETVAPRVPGPLLDGEVEALVSADVGRKQVRALELVVRSLVTESYGDQERLLARLREALSPRVVAQWQAAADAGDVLSGCSFGELASLFVNREEFARYESLYAETPFLTLLKERRRTLQAFLDDVRRFRNTLAHNKRVTNAQLTLLDLYYEEVVGPVQTAFDQGRTKVDPSAHLEVGREALDRFAAGLKEDVAVVRDDLGALLRADLAARLGVIADDTRAVREATRGPAGQAGARPRRAWPCSWARRSSCCGRAATRARPSRTSAAPRRGPRRPRQATTDAAREARAAERTEAATKAAAEAEAAAAKALATKVDAGAAAAKELAGKVDATAAAAEASGKRVEAAADATTKAADAAKAAAEGAKAAAEASAATTEKVVHTLESLKAGFEALAKQGGVIAEADRPEAHYHNARVYEQRGDTPAAMAAYRRYFAAADGLGLLDPHLRYQALLRVQQGPAARARPTRRCARPRRTTSRRSPRPCSSTARPAWPRSTYLGGGAPDVRARGLRALARVLRRAPRHAGPRGPPARARVPPPLPRPPHDGGVPRALPRPERRGRAGGRRRAAPRRRVVARRRGARAAGVGGRDVVEPAVDVDVHVRGAREGDPLARRRQGRVREHGVPRGLPGARRGPAAEVRRRAAPRRAAHRPRGAVRGRARPRPRAVRARVRPGGAGRRGGEAEPST